MHDPKISIITVCYNAEKTIEEAIQSVHDQTYPNKEHIIIDGASKDATLKILSKYQTYFAKVISEPDEGIYHAMNKGLQQATGDIVGFLNSDDSYYDDNVLEKIAKHFEKGKCDACYGDLIYVDPLNPKKVRRYWQAGEFEPGAFIKGWSPPHPTFYVKKEVYDTRGGFDLRYSMGNDIELMMRFLEVAKLKVGYIPKVLVKMKLGGVSNQSITNIIRQNQQILLAAKNLNIPISFLKFFGYKILDRLQQIIKKPKR
ncbi:MAG TPA: glycosyltransferase family 2 protein [Gammaproteobacteria bacterium]|nr:glycosyltransferase family 2 protein [Gammaproteobacteria bacterium]